MHYFFLERFLQPSDWFEKRLAYTRSVAASSMVSVIYPRSDVDLGLLIICKLSQFPSRTNTFPLHYLVKIVVYSLEAVRPFLLLFLFLFFFFLFLFCIEYKWCLQHKQLENRRIFLKVHLACLFFMTLPANLCQTSSCQKSFISDDSNHVTESMWISFSLIHYITLEPQCA